VEADIIIFPGGSRHYNFSWWKPTLLFSLMEADIIIFPGGSRHFILHLPDQRVDL